MNTTTATTQPTPGPWKAQKDIRHSSNTAQMPTGALWWGIYGSTRIAIMEEAQSWRPAAEQEANARLIAAAPDLLAALKEIAGLWDDSDQKNGLAQIMERTARAAIAKATEAAQ